MNWEVPFTLSPANKQAATTNSGGWDYEFTEEIPELLMCNICIKPLRDPHLVVCCGQHFCSNCLDQWFTKNGKTSCPHCRAEGQAFQHVIHKGIKSKVEQLKIRCPNKKDGCQWVGEIGAVKHHLESPSGCNYELIPCTNNCGTFRQVMVQRINLLYHLQNECPNRQYACKHCRVKSTYNWIVKEHSLVCPEVPQMCPNRCGETGIKRKDLKNHRDRCMMEKITCKYAEVGCTQFLERCYMEAHLKNTEEHLKLAMNAYKQKSQELQKMKANCHCALAPKLLVTQLHADVPPMHDEIPQCALAPKMLVPPLHADVPPMHDELPQCVWRQC